jgi:maleylacetoacetate isomerase
MKLKLYHYWRSSSSWRVRWALTHKGIPAEYIAISLLNGESESPEHLARNPLGYVPVLEVIEVIEEGKKAAHLFESIAIIEWLEETHPQNPLLPRDPWSRARARQLAEIINADTQPLQNLPPQELHSQDPAEKKRWAQHWIRLGLQTYETIVRETAGQFSIGNEISIADLCLVPQVYNAKRYDIDLSAYPIIQKICAEAEKTEAWQQSEPERFKPEGA